MPATSESSWPNLDDWFAMHAHAEVNGKVVVACSAVVALLAKLPKELDRQDAVFTSMTT